MMKTPKTFKTKEVEKLLIDTAKLEARTGELHGQLRRIAMIIRIVSNKWSFDRKIARYKLSDLTNYYTHEVSLLKGHLTVTFEGCRYGDTDYIYYHFPLKYIEMTDEQIEADLLVEIPKKQAKEERFAAAKAKKAKATAEANKIKAAEAALIQRKALFQELKTEFDSK